MAGKLTADQKRTVRASLIGLRASYTRTRVKYAAEAKVEFVAMVDKELAKVAEVLMMVEEL